MNLSAALLVLLPLSTLTVGCGAESPDGAALQDGSVDGPRDLEQEAFNSLCHLPDEYGAHVASMRFISPHPGGRSHGDGRATTLADCEYTCAPGYATCGNRTNASICATRLTNTTRNCGACGVVCAMGELCLPDRCLPAR